MEQHTYQYFEHSKSSYPLPHERSRAKSVIPTPKSRICCECGAEECPTCGGRSSSPSKSNRPSLKEFSIPKQYYIPIKSTTHDSYRTYESQRDRDMLFSYPAGRPNPDETYFERSPNDPGSGEKRKFSNIERYKAASPVMKRGLQSHISDLLGYDDTDSREDSPRKEGYTKDIFAQGCPAGIYRNSASSLSPTPKLKIPWQRITKQDLSPDKEKSKSPKKKLLRLKSSPLKSGEGKRPEWKRDVSPNSLSRFQDKIKQASMLLKSSKTKYGNSISGSGSDQEMIVQKKKGKDGNNNKFMTENSTQEEQEQKSWKSKGHIRSTGEIESNGGNNTTEGDGLMNDIVRRYGNANRSKVSSLEKIKTLSRGNSVEGYNLLRKKSSREAGESSNGSIPVMTEPEASSHREEQVMSTQNTVEKIRGKDGFSQSSLKRENSVDGLGGRMKVKGIVGQNSASSLLRNLSMREEMSGESQQGSSFKKGELRRGESGSSVGKESGEGSANRKKDEKSGVPEVVSYREKRLERQNSESRQIRREGSESSMKRENSIESLPLQISKKKSGNSVGIDNGSDMQVLLQTEQEQEKIDSRNTFGKKRSSDKGEVSFSREVSQEEFSPYQKPPSMKDIDYEENRTDEFVNNNNNEKQRFERQNSGNQYNNNLEQQAILIREGSQGSLRREGSAEAFQFKRKGTGNSSSSNLSVILFQTEQHNIAQPELGQQNTSNKYPEKSETLQYSMEGKPPVSKKSSLIRENSQASLVRESSVEEFNPNKKSSSRKDSSFVVDTEHDSKQEDVQVYHSVKRAIPQYPSLRKGGSYRSLAGESSDQESVGLTKKKITANSLNTLSSNNPVQGLGPFGTEPDQQYESTYGVSDNMIRAKIAELSSDGRFGSIEPMGSTQVNSIEKSQIKKAFSVQEEERGIKDNEHSQQRYYTNTSQGESGYPVEVTKKPVIAEVGPVQPAVLLPPPRRMVGDMVEKVVVEQENSQDKPVRVNSWTSLPRNVNETKGIEVTNNVEEMKVNMRNVESVSVTDVEPAVVEKKKKPQEIEDIIKYGDFSMEKEKEGTQDQGKSKASAQYENYSGNNVQERQDRVLNESYSVDRSVSYEFSFEENSQDKGALERSKSKDLSGSNLLSRQLSEGYGKPGLGDNSGNKHKIMTRFSGAQQGANNNNFLTDDSPSPNQVQTAATVEFHERNSAFYETRGGQGGYKKEVNHSKVVKLKPIEWNQPNQDQNNNVSKMSFAVEPMSAIRVKDEFRKDCRVEYCEVRVMYKDDQRESMLQNFLSGKMIPSMQTMTMNQGNLSARSRRDLFAYNK